MAPDPSDNQSLYESLFKYAHPIMLIIDLETSAILDANVSATEFYQYSRDELLSLTISEINTLSKTRLKKEMARAAREKRKYYHFSHRLKTGEIRAVEVYTGPIHFNGKKALYSIVHDISDKQKTLETLKKSESTIQAMINATDSLVYLFDIHGTIINLNSPGGLLFDKTPGELIGKNFKTIFGESDFSRLSVLISEVVETHNPIHYQKERNGSYYDVNLYPVFNEFDQVDRICVFANDVTDIKRTEKVFTAIETAGGICHEMNQPLQVILGNLEILKMNTKKDHPNYKILETLLFQTEKLGQITKKLTHITRYETKGYVKGTIFDIDKSSSVK